MRLPVIVNLDGFYLSFTREPVELPDQKMVDNFIHPFDPENITFRASTPTSQAVAVLGGSPYSYFRYETHLASLNALEVYDEISKNFEEQFGRKHDAVEAYKCEDAEIVFVMMGCFATKAKAAVDKLREAGKAVGLLRPRILRPFPSNHIQRILAGKKGLAVIDQNLSMGKGGVLHCELASVLYGMKDSPRILASFIGGLGGRDIAQEEFYEITDTVQKAIDSGITPQPRLLYSREELRQMKKLQAVAHVEREELNKEQNYE